MRGTSVAEARISGLVVPVSVIGADAALNVRPTVTVGVPPIAYVPVRVPEKVGEGIVNPLGSVVLRLGTLAPLVTRTALAAAGMRAHCVADVAYWRSFAACDASDISPE